ncbi:omega-hydroxyceramide transacylase isoform X2 [Betta splendens]|nr:omega-hydroxyceramide transacylase isoform X2 [Betta splendens]
MATYQLGVAQCFRDLAPGLLRAAPCVLGSSAGSLVAAAVVCEMSPTVIRDEMLHFAKQMKAFALGPLNPSVSVFHWLERVVLKHLPADAHRLASGRLAVAMTRLTDGRCVVASEFGSKDDVAQALLGSCFVPGFCGMQPPSFRGVYYVDGGFTSFQPVLPTPTLTVSPFSGESDICPADGPCMWDLVVSGATLKGSMANSFRIMNALYPLSLETLEQAYHSGYVDATHFLLQNDLAPGLTIHKLSIDCNETKTRLQLDITDEDEDEMKAEEETTLTYLDTSCRQVGNWNGPERNTNRPRGEPSLQLDVVKNVPLHETFSYVSMFPAWILSYLLLPLMLMFHFVLQNRASMELVFLQALELLFKAWHSLRNLTFFVLSIFLSSLKRNLNGRVFPLIPFLQWMRRLTRYEVGPEVPRKLQ